MNHVNAAFSDAKFSVHGFRYEMTIADCGCVLHHIVEADDYFDPYVIGNGDDQK